MYLLRYIEKMGTGIVAMIRRFAEAGLPEPKFDIGSGFVLRIWRQARELPGTSLDYPETTRKTAPTTQKPARTGAGPAIQSPQSARKADRKESPTMSTTRARVDPGDPTTLPEGRIDAAKVDSTTETEIGLQQREDDAEAMQDVARNAKADRADLSPADRRALSRLVGTIKKEEDS